MKDGGRVDYLDGLRAVAIAAVIGVHWVENYAFVGRGGHIGVDLFFVLSGFIITTVLWKTPASQGVVRDGLAFLKRRVVRLYPALIGLLVLVPVIALALPGSGAEQHDIVGQSALAGAQLTWIASATGDFETVFGHTWSLGIEWLFYLIWPWILLSVRARGVRPHVLARFVVAAAALMYASSFALNELWFTYGPVGRLPGMLAGCALALWVVTKQPVARARAAVLDVVAAAGLAAFGLYVLVGYRTFEFGVRTVGVPLATAVALYLIWYGYARQGGLVRGLLEWAPMATLGRMSYSLYLWHIPPIALLDKDAVDLSPALLGALGVAWTVLATVLSYRWLERPFLRSRSRVLRPDEPVAPSDVVPRSQSRA